jgi:hypothetical protein
MSKKVVVVEAMEICMKRNFTRQDRTRNELYLSIFYQAASIEYCKGNRRGGRSFHTKNKGAMPKYGRDNQRRATLRLHLFQ